MVQIRTHKDKEVEINFGIGELTQIDKELGLEMEQINLGEGLEMLVPKLQTANVIAISKILKATIPNKHKPKNDEELEKVLINILDDYETFQAFGDACLKKLKEGRLTRELLTDVE